MTTYLLGVLIVLACIGIFFIFAGGSRQIIRAILNGKRFNKLYLQYIHATTKHEFDAAASVNNSDRAWSSVFFEKVYELGVSGVPFATRERNLDYIKAEISSKPRVSRKVADELIKVLPKQYGNLSFQAKLACYICELLNQKINGGDYSTQPLQSVHGLALDHLTAALSAWIAGGVYLILSLYVLDDYSPAWVALSSLLLFILMVFPLFNLIGTKLAKLTTVGAIASIIILFLGGFATIAHGRLNSPLEVDLNLYQSPNSKLMIRSYEWLTVNNINCSGKKISVSLHGHLTTPIRFRVSDGNFYFANKDCGEIVPELEVAQTETQAYEFYIAARDTSPFYSGIKSISIVPSYISPAGEIDLDSNTVLNIRLEHWFWGLISNLYLTLGSLGGTFILYLVNFFVNKKNS